MRWTMRVSSIVTFIALAGLAVAGAAQLMNWALTDGQTYCAQLGYAPLPGAVVKLELEALKKIKA